MKSKTMSVSEFKAKSLGIFSEIETLGLQVTVTKRGKAIALVIPLKQRKNLSHQKGKLQGMLIHEDDIVSPLDDDWEVSR